MKLLWYTAMFVICTILVFFAPMGMPRWLPVLGAIVSFVGIVGYFAETSGEI